MQMSAQGTIKRYQLILDKLRYNSYPSFEEMQRFLHEQGFEISRRTLQRDIDAVRNEFSVSILFHRSRKGYYIDQEDSPGYGKLMKLIRLQSETEMLQQSLRDEHEYISFEHQDEWSNIKWVQPLLDAIKHKKIVELSHFTFNREQPLQRRVEPYLLKEYQNRWYLLAINEEGEIRTYGLDRITDALVTTDTFAPRKDFDPHTYYANVIGLNHDGSKCEEVVLAADPLTAKYMKSLKWHTSQEVHSENETEVVFRMYVQPNFELKQKILSYGGSIRVLAPETLVKEIKRELKGTLKKYH
ncbi:MAG TPA: WYL domain-containing protein [Parafilimonas sp.]|nr:WYL domain-containing protein [Parafilimonas sp.]